ncbi:DUF5347 family protein [Klebsiella oxytoca]|uniref:DUF5347 family protein n=1 Tax=Klebsiella oxytoca TaxID=571 RepID=UPI001F46D121|nr:DUF5347 family protein [Klebsiella oxytoca]MCE5370082.1 DUF5347 family protein [Klebsiella oxytoca]
MMRVKEFGVPTAEQVAIGQKHLKHIRESFDFLSDKFTHYVIYFNSLSSRYRGLIYFTAGIKRERHSINFRDLTGAEQEAVMKAMGELVSLINSFRHLVNKH